ncbi:hypothetical protein M407DRAFT_214311 [Tulasnella calospora MUT 4182]|uniref:Uncharacterized protein n=1 Tax=Tulasnella calospora MUT 4182 TaxID=1051891 RepID=A0A0C3LEM2_9AGAM|nr:hypothetical protein M407DRAFT_214311 [Tulasnella calospora MUT 4182]
MPETKKPVELVFDPDIPECLINGLDRYADTLQEAQLDDDVLRQTERAMGDLSWLPSKFKLREETTVLTVFTSIVIVPVQGLCEVIGVNTDYGQDPKVANLNPEHAWNVDEEPVIIFEHKNPAVLCFHSPALVLALILHSRKDGLALEYQPLGPNDATTTEVHDEEDEDLESGSQDPAPHNPADQQDDPIL